MKTALYLILASAAGAAAPHAPGEYDRFGADYKRPQVLSENFFNPFKVQVDLGPSKREGSGISSDSVTDALGKRGVSGVVVTPGGPNRAIIGDEVFTVGDELSFPDGDKPGMVPLVPGATVVLKDVGAKSLGFDVTAEGESARRVTFQLRNFWKP